MESLSVRSFRPLQSYFILTARSKIVTIWTAPVHHQVDRSRKRLLLRFSIFSISVVFLVFPWAPHVKSDLYWTENENQNTKLETVPLTVHNNSAVKSLHCTVYTISVKFFGPPPKIKIHVHTLSVFVVILISLFTSIFISLLFGHFLDKLYYYYFLFFL